MLKEPIREQLNKLPLRKPPKQHMTEKEFLDWQDGETRAEWVDGEVIVMAPTGFDHQDVFLWVAWMLKTYARRKDLGEVVVDMFVRLAKPKRQLRVPDILFVTKRRRAIVGKTIIEGAPDMAIEVLSPESLSRDLREKFQVYQECGVREYWIIDPSAQRVEAYVLGKDGKYTLLENRKDQIKSTVVRGWYLRPQKWLWGAQQADMSKVLAELGVK